MWCGLMLAPVLALGAIEHTRAQSNWHKAGLPIKCLQLFQIYADTAHSTMYYCGGFSGDGTNGLNNNGVMRYQNNDWDTLGDFTSFVRSVVVYHDTLIAAGEFYAVSGDSIAFIVYYDGVQWQQYGSIDSPARKLKILNGDLYLAGSFNYADGHLCNGIAKRVGGHWENVGQLTALFDATIDDMEWYQSDLIVAGSINLDAQHKDVLKYHDGTWSSVGPGLLGGFSAGKCLAVFKGELYVGGLMLLSAGNAGQGIMRWDGSAWHNLGVGPQYINGSYQYNYQIESLTVHDSLLFVGGGFHYVSNTPAEYIATWDGCRWCGLGGFNSEQVISSTFYQDTLYVSGGLIIDGDSVNKAAKFIGANYEDTCSIAMGIGMHLAHAPVSAFEDGNGVLNISGLPAGQASIRLYNALGQSVDAFTVTSDGRTTATHRLPQLANGVYVVSVPGVFSTKVFHGR